MQRHQSLLSAHFIIENEAGTDPLDNIEPCEVISLGVCRSQLSVSTLKRVPLLYSIFNFIKSLFSDYDLSLVCTSKCEDEFSKCISHCGSSDCVMECNRAAFACGDCK